MAVAVFFRNRVGAFFLRLWGWSKNIRFSNFLSWIYECNRKVEKILIVFIHEPWLLNYIIRYMYIWNRIRIMDGVPTVLDICRFVWWVFTYLVSSITIRSSTAIDYVLLRLLQIDKWTNGTAPKRIQSRMVWHCVIKLMMFVSIKKWRI